MSGIVPLVSGRNPMPYTVRDDGFYIERGPQRFNRALYGAAVNGSRFSIFAGDVPEWMLYQAGGAGYVMAGVLDGECFTPAAGFESYDLWYKGGKAVSCVKDPQHGSMKLQALPDRDAPCMLFKASDISLKSGTRLCVIFGGIDRAGDHRNLDAGYTAQEKTLFRPERCKENRVTAQGSTAWVEYGDLRAMLETDCTCETMVIDASALVQGKMMPGTGAQDLAALIIDPAKAQALVRISLTEPEVSLAQAWTEAAKHTDALAARATCNSSDRALDAAFGCVAPAMEGMWIAPYYLHGAWSWRIPLLGWRSRFGPTMMGWGERVKEEARSYFSLMYEDGGMIRKQQASAYDQAYFSHAFKGSQTPVISKDASGSPDPAYHYARQAPDSVFNSDGAIPYGPAKQGIVQYDMQEDFIAQVIYQLNSRRDEAFAREVFPYLKRHLAWQDRCFETEYRGLYENFANYWASDSMQYAGAGCALATANNYDAYTAAAQLAEMLGEDPAPFLAKKEAIRKAFHELLWLKDEKHPAESVDVMGERLVHAQAILPTIVTCITSGILSEEEALSTLDYVRNELEHVVMPDGELVYNSQWAPYHWSVRDVDYADVCHLALCCFLMNRAEDGWKYLRGVIGDSCMRHVAPGAFMCVLEGKSIDFSDTTSMFARVVIEGLFGYRPHALAGHVMLAPAMPEALPEMNWKILGAQASWKRTENEVIFSWQLDEPVQDLRIRLPLHKCDVKSVYLDGKATDNYQVVSRAGMLCLEMKLSDAASGIIHLQLAGEKTVCSIARVPARNGHRHIETPVLPAQAWKPLNMDAGLNSRVPALFSKPYLSPRPKSCSLQVPWSLLPASWCIGAAGEALGDAFGFILTDDCLLAGVRDSVFEACGVPFRQSGDAAKNNVLFVSQWDNFPTSVRIPLDVPAGQLALLITGYTNHMQCGVVNARLRFIHADGSETCKDFYAPVDFRSIESGPENERPQDRSCYQVDLPRAVIGQFDGRIHGNAYAQVSYMALPTDAVSVQVEAVANEIVFGVMGISHTNKS